MATNKNFEVKNGLSVAGHHEDALSVKDVELFMLRRIGATEDTILTVQGNLASTYQQLGLKDQALRLRRDVYAGNLRLHGEEHEDTLMDAGNFVINLLDLKRFEEAKRLLRKVMPVARRVFGTEHERTLSLQKGFCARNATRRLLARGKAQRASRAGGHARGGATRTREIAPRVYARPGRATCIKEEICLVLRNSIKLPGHGVSGRSDSGLAPQVAHGPCRHGGRRHLRDLQLAERVEEGVAPLHATAARQEPGHAV